MPPTSNISIPEPSHDRPVNRVLKAPRANKVRAVSKARPREAVEIWSKIDNSSRNVAEKGKKAKRGEGYEGRHGISNGGIIGFVETEFLDHHDVDHSFFVFRHYLHYLKGVCLGYSLLYV